MVAVNVLPLQSIKLSVHPELVVKAETKGQSGLLFTNPRPQTALPKASTDVKISPAVPLLANVP